MRARIRTAGAASLADYELLEVLLFAAVPRRDTKPQAKALLAHFGSLEAVLDAAPDALRAAGLGPRGIAVLSCPAQVASRLAHGDPRGQLIFTDMAAVLAYCDRQPDPDRDRNGVRMFYLDSARHMLADELVMDGVATDMCRGVLARALELHAVSLVAVRDLGPQPPPRKDVRATCASCACCTPTPACWGSPFRTVWSGAEGRQSACIPPSRPNGGDGLRLRQIAGGWRPAVRRAG